MKSTDTSEIELAGKKYPVPCLPFAKNRIVVPSCCAGLAALRELRASSTPLRITDMDHIYLAVFETLNFIDPKITREVFDQMGLNMKELAQALTKIAIQTGVLIKAEGGENTPSKEA